MKAADYCYRFPLKESPTLTMLSPHTISEPKVLSIKNERQTKGKYPKGVIVRNEAKKR